MVAKVQGDPRVGWDELKPDWSYLSHFPPWYSKSGHFPIEISIKTFKSKPYGAIDQFWSLKSNNGCFGVLIYTHSGFEKAEVQTKFFVLSDTLLAIVHLQTIVGPGQFTIPCNTTTFAKRTPVFRTEQDQVEVWVNSLFSSRVLETPNQVSLTQVWKCVLRWIRLLWVVSGVGESNRVLLGLDERVLCADESSSSPTCRGVSNGRVSWQTDRANTLTTLRRPAKTRTKTLRTNTNKKTNTNTNEHPILRTYTLSYIHLFQTI